MQLDLRWGANRSIARGAAGHALDKFKTKEKLPEKLALKQIGFTIGVIVLSAKMAKADGKVTKSEIKAFKEKINVPDNEIKNVARLWDQAKKQLMVLKFTQNKYLIY